MTLPAGPPLARSLPADPPQAGSLSSRRRDRAALSGQAIAVRTEHLVKVYGTGETAVRALDDVTLDFAAGSFTAIMGPSGSGKSTLMHCAAGLDTATAGRVLIGDTDLSTLDERAVTAVRRDRLGFVFQSLNLLPTLTAAQNIRLPLDLAGNAPDPEYYRELTGALGLQDRLSHRPAALSGGQQQRVAIARALIGRPEVVFADEPTGALDSRTGHRLLAFLRSSSRELGQTIVMVTHDPAAAVYADRVVLLADGRAAGDLLHPDIADITDAVRGLDA